jgi:hypothetical protein
MKARMGLAIVTFGLIVAGAGVASAKVYLVSGESPPEGNGASPNSQPVGRVETGRIMGTSGREADWSFASAVSIPTTIRRRGPPSRTKSDAAALTSRRFGAGTQRLLIMFTIEVPLVV